MPRQYRTSFRAYAAWNYQKELEDLNRASDQGWQLVRGGCFHSRFVKNPAIRYRYQLDYGPIEDMGRYIETFREQGWEYINSTFNGWHYFRKLYDPSLPEEEYEIFTDRESFHEMNNRWARLALIIGCLLGLCALFFAVRVLIPAPNLPRLIQVLTLLAESLVLIRGALIMRNPDEVRRRKESGLFLALFFAVVFLGAGSSIALESLRPDYYTEQGATSVEAPIHDNRWMVFQVTYPDRYYLDLDIEAEKPLTFAVLDGDGTPVYEVTETDFHEKDLALRLSPGSYSMSMSCESGFHLTTRIE